MFTHEADILRKLRLIEKQKAELAVDVGQVYQAIADNNIDAIRGALSEVVIASYVLAQRLGIEYNALDETIIDKLDQIIKREPEAERLYGDYSACFRHLRNKRGVKE